MRNFTILVLCLLVTLPAMAQQRKVASFGNISITEEEFKNRFDLTPRLGVSTFLLDSLKMEFLSSLLAEKMWAAEALQRGYDTLPVLKDALRPIERKLVRDALYKQEVESKIVVTPQEIETARYRFNNARILRVVGTPDSATAFKWFAKLKKGTSFDAIAKLTKDTGTVKATLGSFSSEKQEDDVYALVPGQFSKPFKDGPAWFIFQYVRTESVERKKDSMTEPGSTPPDIVKQRKAAKIGKPFLDSLLKGFTVRIIREPFMTAVDAVLPILQKEKAENVKNPTNEFCIDETNENAIVQAIAPEKLNMVLVPLPGEPILLRQFVSEISAEGFCLKSAEKEAVAAKLYSMLNKYIESEMIAREGYRRGLQHTLAVKNDLQMWQQNYFAQFLRNRFLDSVTVSEEEMLAMYDSVYQAEGAPVVRYAEIFSTKLTVMQDALDRIEKGEPFTAVAAALTERDSMKAKNGVYDEMPLALAGELSGMLEKMKPGEIKGPVPVSGGYALVTLIEKKKRAQDAFSKYDQLKGLIRQVIATKKVTGRFNSATHGFARSYRPEINTEVLKDIKVSPIPMYTVRLLGFGGRMLAYPFCTPWENWVPKYLQNQDMP